MAVLDGPVLVENIFIPDRVLLKPVTDPLKWPGILPDTRREQFGIFAQINQSGRGQLSPPLSDGSGTGNVKTTGHRSKEATNNRVLCSAAVHAHFSANISRRRNLNAGDGLDDLPSLSPYITKT